MCDECHLMFCPSSCPNTREIPTYYKCVNCGEEITEECYLRDKEFNVFCSEGCALEYYGVEIFWYCDDGDEED